MKELLLSLAVVSIALAATPARCEPKSKATPIVGYRLVRQIPLAGDTGWDYLTVDARAHRLYVTRSTYVAVIDTRNGNLVGEVLNTAGVHGVAVAPRAKRGYASDGRENSVTVFHSESLKPMSVIDVGQGPDCIVYDPFTDHIFTFNGKDNSSSVVDGRAGKVIGTITLPGKPEFAVADGKGRIYENLEDKDEVAVIDTAGMLVESLWPLGAGDSPSGIAVDTVHHRLFSVCRNQKLIVQSTDDGHVVADLPIGAGPDACAFDPIAGLVFCPGGEEGTVTIYKQVTPDRYSLLTTLTTRQGARTIALDEQTHHVFTVTATPAPDVPGQPGGRRNRHYVSGSFVILEYAPY